MQLLDYFRSVVREAKNVKFPTKEEVKITSIIIVIILIIMMIFIGFADLLISKLIRMLLGI